MGIACVSAKYTHTADQKFPARSPKCKLAVTNMLPEGEAWREIGVINVQVAQSAYGTTAGPNTPDELLELIHDDVCAAGGEHIVGEVNGLGQYIRGTVLRRRE